MPTESLPSRPSVEKLKGTAKTLRDDVRRGSPEAIEIVREHHPRLDDLAPGSPPAQGFKLADAQLTVARHYGFPSWPRLRSYVEVVNRLTRSPHEQPVGQPLADDGARADELLRLACLTYGADDPARPTRALALLADHPHLARWSIHTMAAVGDAAAADTVLVADPAQANRNRRAVRLGAVALRRLLTPGRR